MPTGIPSSADKIGWYFYPNDLERPRFSKLCKKCKRLIKQTDKLRKELKSPLTVHWIGPYAVSINLQKK